MHEFAVWNFCLKIFAYKITFTDPGYKLPQSSSPAAMSKMKKNQLQGAIRTEERLSEKQTENKQTNKQQQQQQQQNNLKDKNWVWGGLGVVPRQLPERPGLAESLRPAGLNY